MHTMAANFSNILNLSNDDRHELFELFEPLMVNQILDKEKTFLLIAFADKSSIFLDLLENSGGKRTCTVLDDIEHPEHELLTFMLWMKDTKPTHPFSKCIIEFFQKWEEEIKAQEV